MPRDGSNVYGRPAGTTFSPGTKILSSKVNLSLDDIAADLNLARPINAGGTGGTTAAEARANLGVDAAVQPFTDVASAATTDIGAVASQNVRITGTTTITSLGTATAGTFRRIRFAGALTLTQNPTSLILPGKVNILTQADDEIEAISLGSGNWYLFNYNSASAGMITPWVAYTPTFSGIGTPADIKCRSRRVGSSLEVECSFTAGVVTATTFDMSLGYNGVNGSGSCDTFWNSYRPIVGVGVTNVGLPITYYVLALGGSNLVNLSYPNGGRDGLSPIQGTVIGNGSVVNLRFSVPINGWN